MSFIRSFAIRSKSKQTIVIIKRHMRRILIHTSKFHATFSVARWKVDGFQLHSLNANMLAFTRSESHGFTLLTSFYGYNAFGCIYIWLTLKNKKISLYQLLYFRDMFLNGISLNFCKKPRNVHFDLILFFHFPVKLVLLTYGPFSWSASCIFFKIS